MFFKISDSSLCIKPFTFGNIHQGRNSTLRSTFLLSEDNSVFFNKHSIVNYMQNVNSKFEVYALKLDQLVIESVSGIFDFYLKPLVLNIVLRNVNNNKLNASGLRKLSGVRVKSTFKKMCFLTFLKLLHFRCSVSSHITKK